MGSSLENRIGEQHCAPVSIKDSDPMSRWPACTSLVNYGYGLAEDYPTYFASPVKFRILITNAG